MNEEKILIKKKNTELNASAEEIRFLSYNNRMLVPCQVQTDGEEVSFEFFTEGLSQCREMDCDYGEKYRFLVNCSNLFVLSNEFEFSLNPENLMCDINYCAKVLIRDKCEGDKSKESFFKKYKSLAACILYPKFTYEDYFNGRSDLFKKNSKLASIYECKDVSELQQYLLKTYQEYINNQRENEVLVSKKQRSVAKVCFPILIALVIVFGFFASFAYLKAIPYKDVLLAADEEYLSGNYTEVQEMLSEISVDDLPFSQKYILSRSCVSSESMTQDQKKNILEGLTVNTDEAVIEYWIYVGRLDFDNAIDMAQKIGDDELLLYAYIKQRSNLEGDNTMSGEEKTEKLNQIDEKIASITDSVTKEDTGNGKSDSVSINNGSATEQL